MLTGPDTLETIRTWPVVRPPALAEDWPAPVSHEDFLNALLAEIRDRKWGPGKVTGAVSRFGADLAAAIPIVRTDAKDPVGWVPALGVVRSTAWRKGTRFYAGAWTEDRSSSLVTHAWTSEAQKDDLNELARTVLDEWEVKMQLFPRTLKELRRQKMNREEAGRLLFEAGRTRLPFGRTGAERVMPGSRVFLVDNLFREREGTNALDLLIAFGAIARQNSPVDQLDQLATMFTMVTAKQTAGA